MKTPTLHKGSWPGRGRLPVRVAIVATSMTCLALIAQGQTANNYQIVSRVEGGLSPCPDITSTKLTDQSVTFTWNGFAGPYQLQRALDLSNPIWDLVGSPTTNKTLTLPADQGVGFFRVKGGSPPFTGAETCVECHPGKHDSWAQTRHAGAFDTLKAIGQGANGSCLPCHTVGYGTPTGFKDEATTPYFEGVQCENCHGPAGDHASNPADLSLRPIRELSTMMCGGCHTGYHHPTYEDITTSPHPQVVPDVASSMISGGAARITSCGPCHSGAARMAMINSVENGTPLTLPSGDAAAANGVTCGVCHDAHGGSSNSAQLRNPLASLTPFSYSTATNTSFAAQYNAQINLCGQCHNMRGARWTDTSRPPHHSPQYNILIGAGGVETTAPPQSKHRENPTQCAGCHVYEHSPQSSTPQDPVVTGHSFVPDETSCLQCHTATDVAAKKDTLQTEIQQSIDSVKGLLNTWGSTRAVDALRTKYGGLSWEYSTPGGLSNPTGDATVKGPTTTEQALVPDNIKQARFNLYLVYHDQSKGVHNAAYARYLLAVAQDKVNTELTP